MTSRMTATDELRRLLDERGAEWTEPNNKARSHTTYWTAGALRCIAVEFTDGVVSVSLTAHRITPEQAIEATLGKGECREVKIDRYWRGCGECGYVWEFMYGIGKCERPRYCPNCGRKVRA